jgi:hypothetical protein
LVEMGAVEITLRLSAFHFIHGRRFNNL